MALYHIVACGLRRPCWLLAIAVAACPGLAQTGSLIRDQTRRAAEAATARRAARATAPITVLDSHDMPRTGIFPVDAGCRPISRIVVDGDLPRRLRWVPRRLIRYEGHCVGQRGLNYILRDLQGAFLDRGLVTTRAGLPQQDLTSGILHLVVIPGRTAGLRGGSRKARRSWQVASPLHDGDIVDIRAVEQGLDQMRRLPGREVSVDLAPGDGPGDTRLDLHAPPAHPVTGSVSLNNFAGRTVGRWQATGQVSVLDLLGANEILGGYYNARIGNPSIPADSTGTGASFEIPWGWWTFGIAGSVNRYDQHVIGQVEGFDTRGTLRTIAATITRVVHRDRMSKTSFQIQLQRRWGRSYIDDIEIGLQHQDLADVQMALIERRRWGPVQLDGELAWRFGLGILGSRKDEPDQPASLPTARYRIGTLDLSVTAPLAERLAYHAAFRGQFSDRPLFGPDMFSVGGPYTVRGFESDHALLGRSGWYLRQELAVRVSDQIQPFAFADLGGTAEARAIPAGLGAGLRIQALRVSLDAWLALPVATRRLAGSRLAMLGLTAGWTL